MKIRLQEDRAERSALAAILILVGVLAGWTSVRHVVDWTMINSPGGTPLSAGGTNAAIADLVPIACAVMIRRRRRYGQSIRWHVTFGVAAVLFSLSAQLSVATPSLSGWIVSAAPTLAFLGIAEMVVSFGTSPESPAPGREVEPLSDPAAIREGATILEPRVVEPAPTVDLGPPVVPEVPAADSEDAKPRAARAPKSGPRRQARSLTHFARVQKAVAELPKGATAEVVAAKAGVSGSTARRHMITLGVLKAPTSSVAA